MFHRYSLWICTFHDLGSWERTKTCRLGQAAAGGGSAGRGDALASDLDGCVLSIRCQVLLHLAGKGGGLGLGQRALHVRGLHGGVVEPGGAGGHSRHLLQQQQNPMSVNRGSLHVPPDPSTALPFAFPTDRHSSITGVCSFLQQSASMALKIIHSCAILLARAQGGDSYRQRAVCNCWSLQ